MSTGGDQHKTILTSEEEEETRSAAEFNRLYSQYKRAGYERIAMIYRAEQETHRTVTS